MIILKRVKEGTGLQIEKILTKKVSERVVEQIESWIETGEIKSGDKLPSVRELCEQFAVGRSAVRDAITTLKGQGILEVRQGEGAFVCEFDSAKMLNRILLVTKEDVHDLFSVRKIMEAGIAEMAALNCKNDNVEEMGRALGELERADMSKGWEADYHFHIAIAKATQNHVLVELMQTISTTMQKAMIDIQRIILSEPDLEKAVFRQHHELYEAIKNRHAQKSRQCMLKHLVYVEQLLHQHLSPPTYTS